ncbi:hypothetical protein [Oricola thermophila]|uniref:DUF1311 domain-containing protein n=1 Tax=Oricola thermophila TaxID=2742145 RepID=A0A6N1VD82_9HYPH|nr:hypothetical protein [Oricola thermophila]QKV16987.1 hypothetical protein HTY61_00155 [Oricola thermophila]
MKTKLGILACALAIAAPVHAADLAGGATAHCAVVQPSSILAIQNDNDLYAEIGRMMEEAVNVADDASAWVDSRRQAFTWASEAKVACGKAYGYMKYDVRDEDTINKCECFYERMHQYMY